MNTAGFNRLEYSKRRSLNASIPVDSFRLKTIVLNLKQSNNKSYRGVEDATFLYPLVVVSFSKPSETLDQ